MTAPATGHAGSRRSARAAPGRRPRAARGRPRSRRRCAAAGRLRTSHRRRASRPRRHPVGRAPGAGARSGRAAARPARATRPTPGAASGRACWVGAAADRCVSAMSSRRASASSRSGAGPSTAVHATFHPGSPADFERPWSAKVSASPGRAATDPRGGPRRGNSTKTSSTMSAQSRRAHSASSRAWSDFAEDPAGRVRRADQHHGAGAVVGEGLDPSRSSAPSGSSGRGKARSSTDDSSARKGSSG